MTHDIFLRLSPNEVEQLEEISKKENRDIDSMIVSLVQNELKLYRMKEAANKYLTGEVCIAEAAEKVKVNVFEMIDFIKKEKIKLPIKSDDEKSEKLIVCFGCP